MKRITQKERRAREKIMTFIVDMGWMFEVANFERKIEYVAEDDNKGTAAQITFEERYQYLTIKIFPTFFEQKLEEQRKILLHELCHSFTIPLHKINEDMLNGEFHSLKIMDEQHERTTSKIENILDGLLQDRYKYAKEAYAKYAK